VCTIGPSSNSIGVIRALIGAGMDVARLNFSHGTHEEHRAAFATLRNVAAELGRNVAVLTDLQGPKIRTGPLENGGPVELEEGASLCVTTRDVPGDASCVSTTYGGLPNDVRTGDRILLDDGKMELQVEQVAPPDVLCRVMRGGPLHEHKGMNLPGVHVTAPSLTPKDLDDLALAVELGADYVGLSFVRSPDDMDDIRKRIERICAAQGGDGQAPGVVAKIERPEALDHFDEILRLSDAVMVARGDLGIEVDLEDVPQIQKDLIGRCNDRGIPVITATQMLESMMNNARPTRAEVTDVANAIYDGTDAVMLSGETAIGRYPYQAVRFMADIAAKADAAVVARPEERKLAPLGPDRTAGSHSDAIGAAVSRMSRTLDVVRIVCFTQSGYTAKAIARYRPLTPVTAITLADETLRRCALIWGVDALKSQEIHDIDDVIVGADTLMIENHLAERGDTIVIVAGTPVAIAGRTNLLHLHIVGEST